jgi:two-component system CheB/CheR fusion protein
MSSRKPKSPSPPPDSAAKVTKSAKRRTTGEPGSGGEPQPGFPVVGLGSSAGGIEAFRELLGALPPDTGMAFVLVQHLDPSHPSKLSEILARATRVPVREATHRTRPEPNTVYVIPPASDIVLSDGLLQLSPRSEVKRIHRPIDPFFRSLAEEKGHQAIGIVLSGTASDGTLGCEEIKAAGGVTFAQDQSAQYGGMPDSAAASGCVDFVLPPRAIAAELVRIGTHPYVGEEPQAEAGAAEPGSSLREVMELLHRARGVDFTQYKISTLQRRVTRRMVLQRIDNLEAYVALLREDPEELEALFHDILINVTSFFRNPDTFEYLKTQVIPRLTLDRPRHIPVRCWVVGCSTGEEAYSLAIAFAEANEQSNRSVPVQIFASDLNHASVEKARSGLYPKAIAEHVSRERLRRFFTEGDGSYRISKLIRDQVVFATHNVLTDPPFSRMDFVCCRNLLIYLDAGLQQQVITTLHYALKPEGILWLGSSESLASHRDLFEAVEAKHRIFSRKPARTGPSLLAGLPFRELVPPRDIPVPKLEVPTPAVDSHREADRLMLLRYAPAAVLINSDLDILQFRGDTGAYLTPSPGKATFNLLKMLREGLLVGVRAAVEKAKRSEAPVRTEDLRVKAGRSYRPVTVEVTPLKGPSLRDACYLVVFEDPNLRSKPGEAPAPEVASEESEDDEKLRLIQELAATREYLQSVIEQQEGVNEELQSANEEVQSANEELQSINEEMETSREEIQSSNEELATVNDELSSRNDELTQSNNDLLNLLSSVEMAIVMLGPNFRIRRFTPSAEKLLNLITTDVGRPITDIKLNIDVPELEQLLPEVIDSATPRELEAQDRHGRWYSLRIRPYRTLENQTEGVVLVLVDIDQLKRGEQSLRASAERLRILQDRAPIGIYEIDHHRHFLRVNDCYCQITGYAREDLLTRRISDIIHPDDQEASEALHRRLEDGQSPSSRIELRYLHQDGHTVWVEVHSSLVRDAAGRPQFGVGIAQDITERRRNIDAMRESEARFHDLADTAPVLMWVNGLYGPEFMNRAFVEYLGLANKDVTGFDWFQEIHPDDREAASDAYQMAFQEQRRYTAQYRLRRKDGEYRWMKTVGVPRYIGGEFVGLVGSSFDVTDLEQAAQLLRDADRTKNEFLAVLAHELRNPLAPLRNVVHLLRAPDADHLTLVGVRDLMERQVQTIARMVDDLLDVSRITQGKIQLQREPVELNDLLTRTIEQYRQAFEARGLELEVAIPDEPVRLDADPVRLEQIVSNLLTNALKFTRRGGRVSLSAQALEDGGPAGRRERYVEIRVRDDGAGMDPDVLPRVFDPFVQADRSLARSQGGLGIGLTLVRNLVRLHGGEVEASSAGIGKGSEFVVRLPVAPLDADGEPGSGSGNGGAPAAHPRRILIIDDNADAGDSLAAILRLSGHDVRVTRDGEAALEQARGWNPEIILLDIGLPGKDGYQVARELRHLPHLRTAMLVGVSGYGQPEDRYRARDAGFDHYFTKPVNLAALEKILALPLRAS